MKVGLSLMLGLLLAFVLVFAYWLRTSHRLVSPWPPNGNRGLDQVEGLVGLASSYR